MGLLVGVGQIADRLIFRRFFRGEGEGHRFRVALLQLHLGEIHAAGVDTRGRAGLEPADGDAQLFQTAGQLQRRLESVGAGVSEHVAYDGAPTQIGAGGHHHCFDLVDRTGSRDHSADRAAVVHPHFHHFRLPDEQVFRLFQGVLHDLLVFPPVGLGTERVDGRAFAPVEQPILDAGFVRRASHLAAQSVQLPHQLPLSSAADGGVAGHIAHCVQIDGKTQGAAAQSCPGQRRFNAGVTGADDCDVKCSGLILHGV